MENDVTLHTFLDPWEWSLCTQAVIPAVSVTMAMAKEALLAPV